MCDDLKKAVVAFYLANEAFAGASFEESDEAGNRLMEAEDVLLALGCVLVGTPTERGK